MKKTEGKTDRAIRGVLAVGAVIGAGVLGFSTGWGVVLLVVAGVLVVTASTGYCPAYSLLHIDTLPADRTGEAPEGGKTADRRPVEAGRGA